VDELINRPATGTPAGRMLMRGIEGRPLLLAIGPRVSPLLPWPLSNQWRFVPDIAAAASTFRSQWLPLLKRGTSIGGVIERR
jgi:hypothetical protein